MELNNNETLSETKVAAMEKAPKIESSVGMNAAYKEKEKVAKLPSPPKKSRRDTRKNYSANK